MLYLGDTFLLAYVEIAHSVSRAGWKFCRGDWVGFVQLLLYCVDLLLISNLLSLEYFSVPFSTFVFVELFLCIKFLTVEFLEYITVYTFKEDT